jgi:hypothetical protein
MSEHPALAFLRQAHQQAEELVRVISHGGFAPQTWHVEPSRSQRWVQVISKSRAVNEPPEAAARMDDQPVMLVQTGRNGHLHVVLHDPAAVLHRVEAEREQLALHQPVACGEFTCDCHQCCAVCRWTEEDEDGRERAWGEIPLHVYPCRTVLLLAEAWGWAKEAP